MAEDLESKSETFYADSDIAFDLRKIAGFIVDLVPGVGAISHSLNLLDLPENYKLDLRGILYTGAIALWQATSWIYLISSASNYLTR